MKVFLTGATGFIGGHLLRALLEGGAEVRCLRRSESPRRNLDGLDVEVVTGDLRDGGTLRQGLEGCDLVFHCAADYRFYSRNSEELYESNVEGTRNLLQAASEAGAKRVVYTSSTAGLVAEFAGRLAGR